MRFVIAAALALTAAPSLAAQAVPAASNLTYDMPIVFAPGGDGRAENEGYDAFVPLIDSGISLYVWTGPKFLSVVAFTCKRFDAEAAVAATREFFAMSSLESASF